MNQFPLEEKTIGIARTTKATQSPRSQKRQKKLLRHCLQVSKQQIKEVLAEANPPAKKKRKKPEVATSEEVPAEEIPSNPYAYHLPPTHPGFFGGGSVFHSMIGEHAYGAGHFGPGWPGAIPPGFVPGVVPVKGGSGGYGMGGTYARDWIWGTTSTTT